MAFTSSSRQLLKTKTPGLIVFEKFLAQKSCEELTHESLALRAKIDGARASALSYQSHQHNITGERHYKAVVVQDQFRNLNGEDFTDYGDQSHTLTYFRDNHNIPFFVSNHLIAPLCKLPVIAQIARQGLLNWRFTFNTYSNRHEDEKSLAGFPFHQDIAVNGLITMIYSLGAKATFQIRDPENHTDCESIELEPNSLLLLTGKARWDYEHSVIPSNTHSPSLGSTRIRRISLVLGCKPHRTE